MNMSERKARLTQLRRAVYALAKKAGKGRLTSQEQSQLVAMDRESERLESIIKGERDVAHFAYEYFSDERNPRLAKICRNLKIRQSLSGLQM